MAENTRQRAFSMRTSALILVAAAVAGWAAAIVFIYVLVRTAGA